jgi:hypothetical protein
MKTIKTSIVVVVFILLANMSFAQNKWSAEFRPNLDFPTEDTGHGLGYEFGLGIDYTFSEMWHIRPQFGYRALSRDIDIANSKVDIDFNYIAFGIGIAKSF